jgi:poly-gamma-glutamate synthesis protein (capsule biosynthesis protein)
MGRHSWIAYLFSITSAIGVGVLGAYAGLAVVYSISRLIVRPSVADIEVQLTGQKAASATAALERISSDNPVTPVSLTEAQTAVVGMGDIAPVTYSSTTILAFVGDLMFDRGVDQAVKRNGGGDYGWIFADTAKLADADILFGNLEGPVSDRGRDGGSAYSFRMEPALLPVLRQQGFDVLSVANNHAGDWGIAAFGDSLDRLAEQGFLAVGGGANYFAAAEPRIIEKNGVKFGWLGFSDVGPDWLRAGSSTPGLLAAADPRTPELIKKAAEKSDVLIVSFHFGDEYEALPNWRQKQLAKMAIERGAKIVVGHHPHVVEPVETYKNGLIMYSLGNFVFDQYFSTSTMQGLAVKVIMRGDKIECVENLKTKLDWKFRVRVE